MVASSPRSTAWKRAAAMIGVTVLASLGSVPAFAQTTAAGTTGAATSTDRCEAIRDNRGAMHCMIEDIQQRTRENNAQAAAAAKHSACTRGLMSWADEDKQRRASRITIVQDLMRAAGITDVAKVDTCALLDKAKDRELKQGRITPGVPPAAPVALQVQ